MLVVRSNHIHFGPKPSQAGPGISPNTSPSVSSSDLKESSRTVYGAFLHKGLWKSETSWEEENATAFNLTPQGPYHGQSTTDSSGSPTSLNTTKEVAAPISISNTRYGNLSKGLLCDEHGRWVPCVLRSFLLSDLRRIGRAEAIRRRMVSPSNRQRSFAEERNMILKELDWTVEHIYDDLCDTLLTKKSDSLRGEGPSPSDGPCSILLDDATDYGIYQFVRSNVFWVDLISKVRAHLGHVRVSAYPCPAECGNLSPLWQLVLIADETGTICEVIQVVPYADGRSLMGISGRHHLRPLYPPRVCRDIIRSLAKTLNLMYSVGYCHRDVTPTNVLMKKAEPNIVRSRVCRDASGVCWYPVLADFESLLPLNLATDEGGWSLGWHGGTRGFSTPPEAFFRTDENTQPEDKSWGLAWDTWGLGSTAYALLWGSPPFWGNSADDVSKKIVSAPHDHPSPLVANNHEENQGSERDASMGGPPLLESWRLRRLRDPSALTSGTSCDCVIVSQRPPAITNMSTTSIIATSRAICVVCSLDLERYRKECIDDLLVSDPSARLKGLRQLKSIYPINSDEKG